MRVDPNYIQNLSAAVSASAATEQQLTAKLSSGLRVSTLSDDPLAASRNAALAASLSRADSFVQTAGTVQGTMQATDSTLGEVVSQVTKALSLATEAGDGTLGTANLQALAQQVSGLRDSVLALANTSYAGSYLFSGTKGNIAPFTLDNSTDPPAAVYHGDAVSQHLTTADGQSLTTGLPGAAVFQSGSGDLLAALNHLASALGKGDLSALPDLSAALSTGLGQVSAQRASLGSSMSALESASSYASTQSSQLKIAQSALLNADPAEVATDLQTSEVQHQALLSVIASLSKTDLFDYLR